jgi:hypothetical protein
MKRLSWSKLFTLAALVSLGLAANIASAAVPARIPAPYPTANPLVTPSTPRAEFEGPSQVDFLNGNSTLGAGPLGSAQIAVGPEDILLVANSSIWRLPNGNAPGVIPTGLNPGAQLTGGQPFGAQRVFLDNWIGEQPLGHLCPTGAPRAEAPDVLADPGNSRNATTCQFDNATVVYDQMQGRFLVLFTVVDTGLTANNTGAYSLTRPRKASWVLLVSRYAVLLDQAVFQGTEATTPVTPPNAVGTSAFVTPTPSTTSNTGNVNTNLWAIIYGNSLGTQSNSGTLDGFGSDLAFPATPGNGELVGVGNINSLPAFTTGAINTLNAFDCSAGAVYATQTVGTKVCYFPTSARLGVDNDTVTIASAVVNTNINGADLSLSYNPLTAGGAQTFPAFAGTRIRVIKKTALYIKIFPPTTTSLVAGNQFAGVGGQPGTAASRPSGDYYDLFSSPGNNGQPVNNTIGTNAGPPMPFTAVASDGPCNVGIGQGFGGGTTRCAPVFYEPAHLRGRAMATYSNLPVGGPNATGPTQSSQTYLVGSISYDGTSTQYLYLQGVRELYGFNTQPANAFGPVPFYPVLQNQNVITSDLGQGFPSSFTVNYYRNPATAPQQNYRNSGGAAPNLFVGDARPHAVIFREGHLYDARVISAVFPGQGQFPGGTGTPLSTTVAYEIVQKLGAGPTTVASTVYQTNWQNQTAFAPMFDVPANVDTFGVGNPINGLPFLEKLFVGTTYPPLAGLPDTSYNAAPGGTPVALQADFVGGDPRSRETFGSSGVASTQLPQMANCYSDALSPGAPASGVANNPLAWVSLFDTRCGQDVSDINPVLRDPRSGNLGAQYALAFRGGEAVDPNDGSLWNFGAYAQKRDSGAAALAHFGTFAANYKLSFPLTDAYNNSTVLFNDVAPGGVPIPEFTYIQMAVNLGFTPSSFTGGGCTAAGTPITPPNVTCIPFAPVNTVDYPTIPAGVTAPGAAPAAGSFGPNDQITRREMAYWIVKGQMDEAAITAYLTNSFALTGAAGLTGTSFADVPTTDPGFKYIEVMARRGYTSGCAAGVARRYCPDFISTRRDLAAFIIRAKFSNVFASVLSGCAFTFVNGTTSPTSTLFPPALTTNCNVNGDNFGLFVTGLTYFSDNPQVTGNDWYPFIQKMRELRITNGTFLGVNADGRNGTYSLGVTVGVPPIGDPGNLLRKQIASFVMRAFFF